MNNLLNFKSFFKFLGRNKAYTLIDVFGLSVSLMFVLLIAVYTVQEMSTDKFHTKADRIYLVGNENWMATGAAIPYKIKERYPEVEKVCPVVAGNSSDIVVVSGDRKLKANVMFADSTFFDFFDFRLLQGTREQALAAGNYAVVSSSFARKMFGTDDPMGRKLVVGDTISATINGVVEDLLHSSIPEADVIVRWEQVRYLNGRWLRINWGMPEVHRLLSWCVRAVISLLVRRIWPIGSRSFIGRINMGRQKRYAYCRLVSSILRKPLLTLLCEREIGVS